MTLVYNWLVGMNHMLAFEQMNYTAMHTHMPMKRRRVISKIPNYFRDLNRDWHFLNFVYISKTSFRAKLNRPFNIYGIRNGRFFKRPRLFLVCMENLIEIQWSSNIIPSQLYYRMSFAICSLTGSSQSPLKD